MNGFGFLEYKDSMDARDVVPGESYSLAPFERVSDMLTRHSFP